MSKLLTEISRIHELMGIKPNLILEDKTPGIDLQNIVRKFFSMTDEEASKYFKTLSEDQKLYLKSLVNASNELGSTVGDLATAAGVASLRKFIKESGNDTIKRIFAKAERELSKRLAGINIQNLIINNSSVASILKNAPTKININRQSLTLFDMLSVIEKQGGVKKSTIFDAQPELWANLANDINKVSDDVPDNVKTYLKDLQEEIYERLSPEDYTEIIKKQEDDLMKEIPDNIITDIKNLTNVDDISTKLKNISNLDQTMRQGDEMDIEVDINNQIELKKLMGEDKENFIKNLNTFEDLENLWVIVQHSDNDLEFQKEILKILQNNQQTIETKFSTNSQDIKMGIAMLEDRVMVNSNTSVVNFRDTGLGDFGDLNHGKQIYGSQGGVTQDGNYWIPRPIELDGKIYFFETPQKLLDDADFLSKLNTRRSAMGLQPMEDYLKFMNDKFAFADELSDEIIPIQYVPESLTEKTLYNLFSKNGTFFSEGVKLIRELTDKFLSDSQKLYVNGASKKELDEYLVSLNFLKNKFGNKKIYVTSMVDSKKTKLMTLDDFIKDVEENFKRIYDQDGNWSPLNKLDTNWRDMPKEITTFMKTVLSKEEFDSFVKKIEEYNNLPKDSIRKNEVENELGQEFQKIKTKLLQNEDYVKNWKNRVDEITQSIKLNSAAGDLSEQKVNEIFKKNGFNILYTASNGSPVDVLLNIDQIVDDTKGIFGGGIKTVQTKTAGKITEGEFEVINGKRTGNWIEKKGTNSFRVEILPKQKISKQSQIDLAAFYDPNTGKTLITGKQKSLAKTVDEKTGKIKIMYNTDGTPIYSNKQELPGASLQITKSYYKPFIVDTDTPKIFQ
jgi:hypothetical protein